jgi:hypothetical protein
MDMGMEYVYCFIVLKMGDRRWAFVYTVMNLWVPELRGIS